MDLWNQINLPPPPTFTFKGENQELDLNKLRNALQEAIRHFKDQGFLSREAALLSRMTYRMKMKFRSAKDFKSLEKVSHALNRFLKCNLASYFKLLLNLVPSQYGETIYLPTRNMFDYILVRLQGLAKLLERIHDSCKIAAYLTNKRLSIGHFWKLFLIVFALISRIYVLVKFNCQFVCDLYAKLYLHASHLKNPGTQWLPKDFQLPADLREWLGVEWVYEEDFIDLTNETLPSVLDFFDLCDDNEDDIEIGEEYVLIDDELNDFRTLKQKKLEKSGLFEMVPNLSKEERKQQAMDLRIHKKQGKRVRRTSMRGFSNDIDCGEVITIDDSFTNGVLEDLKEICQNNKDLKRKDLGSDGSDVDDHEMTKDLKSTINNSVEILSDSGIQASKENKVNNLEDNSFLALEVSDIEAKSHSAVYNSEIKDSGTAINKNVNVDVLKATDDREDVILVDYEQSPDESVQIIAETDSKINVERTETQKNKETKKNKKRKSSNIYSNTVAKKSPDKSVQIIEKMKSKLHLDNSVAKNRKITKDSEKASKKRNLSKKHSETIAIRSPEKSVQIIEETDSETHLDNTVFKRHKKTQKNIKKSCKLQKSAETSKILSGTIFKYSPNKTFQTIEETNNLEKGKNKKKKEKLNKTKDTKQKRRSSKKRKFSDTGLDISESITPKKFKPNFVTSTPIVDILKRKGFGKDNKKRETNLLTPEKNKHKKKNNSFKGNSLNVNNNLSLDSIGASSSRIKTKKRKKGKRFTVEQDTTANRRRGRQSAENKNNRRNKRSKRV